MNINLFQIILNSIWVYQKDETLDKESFILNMQKNESSLNREEIELILGMTLKELLEI